MFDPLQTYSIPVILRLCDGKVNESHGDWFQMVGRVGTSFHGTRKYLPFIATAKNTDCLVPTKTEKVYIKKRSVGCHCAELPGMCVISCSTSAVGAFPMKGQSDSISLSAQYL